jgi:hypothetical protein
VKQLSLEDQRNIHDTYANKFSAFREWLKVTFWHGDLTMH